MIIGHTDSVGPTDKNQILYERRALSVRKFLLLQDASAEPPDSSGMGEFEPIDPAEGPNPRNRRVEFRRLD